jgi:hypothetical protein
MDFVIFRPIGFFRETEEALSEGNEVEAEGEFGVASGSSDGMGFDIDDVGRRKARGESDIAASKTA